LQLKSGDHPLNREKETHGEGKLGLWTRISALWGRRKGPKGGGTRRRKLDEEREKPCLCKCALCRKAKGR